MSILFVADGGPQVGGGHVLRCLTLARALREAGAEPLFLATADVAAILETFDPQMPFEPARPDLISVAACVPFDALVVDHYGLARPAHEALARGRPVLVIDDLADRPLGADLVLDAGPARRPADYQGLVKPGARLLLGPAYAPVRAEFAERRQAALARRDGRPVRRALVALGLTDVGAHTARVAQALHRADPALAIDVAVGSAAPTVASLQALAARQPGLTVHVDTLEMAALTAHADIGVGAAGSTAWERCTLGLPSLTLVLADNQRPAAAALAERGAALVLDVQSANFETDLAAALARLLADAELRRSLAAASAQVCDGRGAERTAQALLELIAARSD